MITKITSFPVFKNTVTQVKNNPCEVSGVFDGFIKKPQETQLQKPNQQIADRKKSIPAWAFALGAAILAGVSIAGIIKGKMGAKDVLRGQGVANYNELVQKFPNDNKYRCRLAQAVGLSKGKEYKLASIGGVEELMDLMKKHETFEDVFSVGEAVYDNSGKILGFSEKNISSGVYGINLHIHTVNSDGKFSVEKLLNDASLYADKRMNLKKQPFYIAITDHDGVQGCVEAVEIIKKNPKKFKNLKLFLGLETTTTYQNPKFLNCKGQIHLLSYGINPYSNDMEKFLTSRIKKNQQSINEALKNANMLYSELLDNKRDDFNLDDFSKISKSIKTGLKSSNLYLKDYLQFKLIYSQMVLKNEKLQKFLNDNRINISKIDYSKPIEFIEQNPNYFFGQKYYDYYYEALKDYIVKVVKNKKTPIEENEIKRLFSDLPYDFKKVLNEIEQLTGTSNSKLFIPPIELPSFDKAVEELSQMEDGVLSFAHPGVIFPFRAIKNMNELPEMYKDLYKIFKEKGKNRAKYVEGFYQSYYKTKDFPIYNQLIELGKQAGLKQTGGLDTHSANIFSI